MSQPFRPLRPAGGGGDLVSVWAAANLPRRKKLTGAACEQCRKRKIKCNAERPACKACVIRDSECIYGTDPKETHHQALKRKYDALEDRQSAFEELYTLLRSRSIQEAYDILGRLRAGASVDALLRHIKSGDVLIQLAVVPETAFRYSLGNVLNVPDFLKSSNNPYMASLVYKNNFDPTSASPPPPSPASSSSSWQPALPVTDLVSINRAMYGTPYHAVEMIDVVLDSTKPSEWTNVHHDDKLLRELLRAYFIYEYPFFPFLHKDYFLQDMTSGRHRFCTPLLVNAILAAGCHGYRKLDKRSEYWDPESLVYRFIAEARRLWELDAGENSITKVQAAIILQLEYNRNGHDRVGWSYGVQAVAMAHDMGLFTTYLRPGRTSWRTVQTLTVWTLYAWQALLCFQFDRPPVMIAPPQLLLPDDLKDYGEIWVRYPTAPSPIPLHFGVLFKAIVELRTILSDIACNVFRPSGPSKKLSLAQSAQYRSRLEQWFGRLPSSLAPENIIIPCHFEIHMHYWYTVARLFEPNDLLSMSESDANLPSDLLSSQSPREIVTQAMRCFQTLIRIYYSCHGGETYDMFSLPMCVFICFASMNSSTVSTPDDEAVSEANLCTAVLCAHIMYGQSQSLYLAEVIFRLMQKKLPVEVMDRLSRFTNVGDVDEGRVELASRPIKSDWPINVAQISNNADDRRLDNLVRAITDLSVDENNTNNSETSSRASSPTL